VGHLLVHRQALQVSLAAARPQAQLQRLSRIALKTLKIQRVFTTRIS
jgi:hypothetical protein